MFPISSSNSQLNIYWQSSLGILRQNSGFSIAYRILIINVIDLYRFLFIKHNKNISKINIIVWNNVFVCFLTVQNIIEMNLSLSHIFHIDKYMNFILTCYSLCLWFDQEVVRIVGHCQEEWCFCCNCRSYACRILHDIVLWVSLDDLGLGRLAIILLIYASFCSLYHSLNSAMYHCWMLKNF